MKFKSLRVEEEGKRIGIIKMKILKVEIVGAKQWERSSGNEVIRAEQ